MIRGFGLFHKLNLKNLSAEDLFNKYMSEFNPGEHSCPWCDTKDPRFFDSRKQNNDS